MKNDTNPQNITLEIPENTNKPISNTQMLEKKQEFEAKLMKGVQNNSQLAKMTKIQIIQVCKRLANQVKSDDLQKELFIGDCVVSNYKEVMQDSETIVIVPEDIKQLCIRQSKSSGYNLQPLEFELLQGICIANEINQ